MSLRIVHGWKSLGDADRGAAVALGNFDGVHRGHQAVIDGARKAADERGVPLGVISFDPHPRRLFHPDEPSFRLMTTDQQARALEKLGVDLFYVLPFDFEMASFSDREFVERVLHEGLGVAHVAVGFDISFGKGRTGSPELMQAYGEEFGFGVSVAEPVGEDGGKFSSTAVREALRDGRPEDARAILGQPFAIEGVVRRGQQLGRQLGFPTANVFLADYVTPKLGVYATLTRLPDGCLIPGVANIGNNPTTGEVETRLEVWLFDFNEDLYGQVIETQLLYFLRPEEKFGSIDQMVEQIRRDAAKARRLLLMHDLCVRLGWCGGSGGHWMDRIPPMGEVTADQFVQLVFDAEGYDPHSEPRKAQRHAEDIEASFVLNLGGDRVDASALRD